MKLGQQFSLHFFNFCLVYFDVSPVSEHTIASGRLITGLNIVREGPIFRAPLRFTLPGLNAKLSLASIVYPNKI